MKGREKERYIKEGERHFKLSDRTVRWVSPGKASWPGNRRKKYGPTKFVNFAVYLPEKREIILKSVSTRSF